MMAWKIAGDLERARSNEVEIWNCFLFSAICNEDHNMVLTALLICDKKE